MLTGGGDGLSPSVFLYNLEFMSKSQGNFLSKAKQILEGNWRDGFTVPTNKLYPFQWNWDSGFVSMGLGHFNLNHAIQELTSLFSGQWENGMIPHIIFHSENETTYFPNYDFWDANVNTGAPNKPKTSGITQPAVHGFILENLLKRFPDNEKLIAFVKAIFPKSRQKPSLSLQLSGPRKRRFDVYFSPLGIGQR